ncbi:unnamed protein product [Didymodactylos carnosus]|uniref:Uncharacterized protein n=1 Tax=Didymodactylos carnosus TaxID=1234261 RepID=A0A816AV39_9BILA|nr:unnamed protein product [Didymodactylos carnosus]CAF4480436.1 unnamed protein product [Didymodactylos carnosus]
MHILVITFLLIFITSSDCKIIRQVIAFGDSFFDTGNVFNYIFNRTNPPSPPYFKGTYSNGPNSITRVVTKIKYREEHVEFKNYAYGGATTDNQLIQGFSSYKDITLKVPGALQQIELFHQNKTGKQIPQKQRLYFLSAGGNNFFYNNSISYQAITESLLKCVQLLLSYGARHIFVLNFPPYQDSPIITRSGNLSIQHYVENFIIKGKL